MADLQSFEVAEGDTLGDLLSADRIRSRQPVKVGLLPRPRIGPLPGRQPFSQQERAAMRRFVIVTTLQAILLIAGTTVSQAGELLPVPDRLVVLTFDDGNKSDVEFVAPLLKRYGFGATFFITDHSWGLGFLKDKKTFLPWDEIRKLHEAGFEIG